MRDEPDDAFPLRLTVLIVVVAWSVVFGTAAWVWLR